MDNSVKTSDLVKFSDRRLEEELQRLDTIKSGLEENNEQEPPSASKPEIAPAKVQKTPLDLGFLLRKKFAPVSAPKAVNNNGITHVSETAPPSTKVSCPKSLTASDRAG